MVTRIQLTTGGWRFFLEINKLSAWFHHMLEKMLNFKDSTWRASLSFKLPLKEPLPKKSDQVELVFLHFTQLQELEPKSRKEDSQ